jgi:hypothetical protein
MSEEKEVRCNADEGWWKMVELVVLLLFVLLLQISRIHWFFLVFFKFIESYKNVKI